MEQHVRNYQRDALGALQDGGGPRPLPVGRNDGLVAGPLVELLCGLDGALDDGPDLVGDDFETINGGPVAADGNDERWKAVSVGRGEKGEQVVLT
jgi:hypothetical protein